MNKEEKEYIIESLKFALDNGNYSDKDLEMAYNCLNNSINCIENEPISDGWIKINSEDDLPKDVPIDVIVNKEPYQGYVYEGRTEWFCIIENRYRSTKIDDCIEARRITHYQPIQKPKPPLY